MAQKLTSTHITIVCCHSIWRGDGVNNGKDAVGLADDEWMLEAFQSGEGRTFRQHVIQGIRAARREGGELWFSGGRTKRTQTDMSEGASYKRLCETLLQNNPEELEDLGDDGIPSKPFSVHADELATDSLQNVLFPIIQSSPGILAMISQPSENRSQPPFRLTIVSHEFKRERFMSLHLPDLGFGPEFISEHCRYMGIDPDGDEKKRKQFVGGEIKALGTWRSEWKEGDLGSPSSLREKRQKRGWDGEQGWRLLREVLHGNEHFLRHTIGNEIRTQFLDRLYCDEGYGAWGRTLRCNR